MCVGWGDVWGGGMGGGGGGMRWDAWQGGGVTGGAQLGVMVVGGDEERKCNRRDEIREGGYMRRAKIRKTLGKEICREEAIKKIYEGEM